MTYIYRLLILPALFVYCGCQPGSSPVKNHSDSTLSHSHVEADSLAEVTPEDTLNGTSQDKIEVLMLPSPDEILNEILGGKIKYNISVVNDLKNESKYLNVKSQALNLGIYLTDLAYINLNNDKTEAFNYFKTIRQLSQKLNIYQPFYSDLFNRIQKNIANSDSINSIFREVYFNMLNILEQTEQNDIYAFVVTGALVESLYIPAVSIEQTDNYQVVATKIFEQKYLINNFYEHLSEYKGEKYMNDMLGILGDIRNIMNKAETKSEKVVLKKNKNHITISGGDEVVVTEQMFRIISNRVKEIRNKIVNTN